MTYADIKRQQQAANPWLQSLSTEDYSRVMSQITGAPAEYKSGIDPGLLSQADWYLNRLIEATGAPEAAGQLGEAAFGETGRQVFHGVPRAIVNMAPMFIPGPGWAATAARLGGAGLLSAAETYGATEKPLPAILTGALAAATPKIMDVAGKATIQAMKGPADAAQAATLRTMMAEAPAEALPRLAQNVAGLTTAPTTTGQVLAGMGAGQAALAGAQTGVEAINILSDEDRHLSELADPAYWGAQALAQAVFGGLDVARLPGQIRQANRVRGMMPSTTLGASSPLESGIGLERPVKPEMRLGFPAESPEVAQYVQNLVGGAPEPAVAPEGLMVQPELLGLETAATPPPEAMPEPLVKPPVSTLPPEEAVARLFSDLDLPQAEGIRALATPEQLATGEKIANEVVNNGGTPEQGVEAGKNVLLHQLREQHGKPVEPPPSLEQDMAVYAERLELAKTDPAVKAETDFVLEQSSRFGEKIGSGSAPDPTYTAYREWLEAGQPEGFDMFKARLRTKVNEQGKGERGRVTFTEFVGDDVSLARHAEEATRAEAPEPVLSTVPAGVEGEAPVSQAPVAEIVLSPEETAALRVTKLKGAEDKGDGITFVPERLMTPARRKALKRGGRNIEVKDWADVTGDPAARGTAILDRRARMAERAQPRAVPEEPVRPPEPTAEEMARLANLKRDPSDTSQMTPEEWVVWRQQQIDAAKAKHEELKAAGPSHLTDLWRFEGGAEGMLAKAPPPNTAMHRFGLEIALNPDPSRLPAEAVSAKAIDDYGITLPTGYVKQGDLYVRGPEYVRKEVKKWTKAGPQFMRDPLSPEALAAKKEMAALMESQKTNPNPEIQARIDQLKVDTANKTHDERMAHAGTFFGKAMRLSGMSEAEMAQRLPTIAGLWTAIKELANTDLALLTEKGRQAYGLFVGGGHPLVMMSASPKSAKLMGYTVAHELIGHGLWDAHARGQLEPKVSMQLDRTRKFVAGALPEDRALMLRWMTEGLPVELRKSPELAEILRTAETVQSPDEVLAHMNALAAMHMVEGRTSNLSGLVKYLPKPLSDFLVNAAQWASKSIRTLKMAFRGNKEMWDVLAGHEEAMKDVMRAGRETEVDALRLQAFAKMQEPGGLMDIMQDPVAANDWFSTVFDTSEFDGYGKDVAKWMVGPQMFKDMAREGKNVGMGAAGLGSTFANALNHIFRPLPQQGASKKAFRHAGELMPRRERMMATAQKAFADIMSGRTIGPWLSFGKNAPLTQFYKKADAGSMKAKDDILRWATDSDRSKTAYEHVVAGTPEVMAMFNKIAPEHQNNAKALLAQQDKLARAAVKDRQDRAVSLAASRTAANAIKDTDVRYEAAHGFFHAYGDRVKAGEPIDYQVMLQEAVPVLTSPGENPVVGVDRATRYVESFKDQVELAAERTAYNMANIGYTTERRLGANRITFTKNGETGFLTADSPKDMKQLMETLRREGATNVKEAEAGLTVMPGERISDMEKGLGAVLDIGRRRLQAKGYSEAEIAEIVGAVDVRPELLSIDAQKDISSTHIKAKRTGGREYLDMTKQQWDWEQANLRQDTMAIADAEMRGVQNDKALMDTPEARTLAVAFNNYKIPDTASMKRISKFGYFMTLAGSPSNMALEVIQPIIAFPWKLVDEGAGPIQANRLVLGSYKKVFGAMLSPKALKSGNMDLSKLSADHQKVIQEAIDNGRLNSQLLNEFGDEGPTTAIFREGAVTLGKLSPNAAEPVQDMAQAAGKLAIKVHNKATNLSTSVALLSGYDFLRSKGLDHATAMKQVWPLLTEGLYTGGRESRAAGIYDVGSARPVSSMMMSLTGYSLNTLAQMAGYISRSTRKGIPRAERMSSVKAAAGMIATQVLFAGMMGLPGVGAAVRIFEKATGFDLEKWLEQLSDAGEDPGTSAMVKTLSMRGISHVLGGPDVSQRMGVTSILGFNEFDGFNLENLFGPVGSYAKKSVEAVGALGRGDVRSAAEAVAPVPLRKTLELWADDWKFQSPTNDELLIKEPSLGEKISYALGWQPVKLNRARQAWSMRKRANEAAVAKDARVMGELADEIVDEKDVGEALKFLNARELERGPDFDRRAEAMKIAERVEKRVFVRDPGKEGTRVTGAQDESVLRAMGVFAPTEEAARAQLRDNVLGALGAKGYGHKALESYRQIDELRRRNPFLTVAQARAQLTHRQPGARPVPTALQALLPVQGY